MKRSTLRRLVYPLIMTGLLSGCAVAPNYYYSLSASDRGPDRPAQAVRTAPYAIDVSPVVVPGDVDRPQIVVQEQGSSLVTPLTTSLWASPLGTQIRNALANSLVARLGVPTLVSGAVPENLPVWRVHFQVHRFESVYANYVVMDASWQLTPINQGDARKAVLCRASTRILVDEGVSALVHGHNQAIARFAGAIATQINGARMASDNGLTGMGCT